MQTLNRIYRKKKFNLGFDEPDNMFDKEYDEDKFWRDNC